MGQVMGTRSGPLGTGEDVAVSRLEDALRRLAAVERRLEAVEDTLEQLEAELGSQERAE